MVSRLLHVQEQKISPVRLCYWDQDWLLLVHALTHHQIPRQFRQGVRV